MKEFPTGKPHVSFSEVRVWKECPWKHKLIHIDKAIDFETSVHLEYGTIIHDALENFLKSRTIDIPGVKSKITEAWNKHRFDQSDVIENNRVIAESQGWKYKHDHLESWLLWSEAALKAIPDFMEEYYPEWECISAEEQLYEQIDDQMKFKGFIDGVIKFKKGKRDKIAIIDWKTASPRGWSRDKIQDIKTTAQLMLYKHYWSRKYDVKLSDIACHFVLLKRVKKPEKVCKIIEVSAGPKSIEKANKMVRSMIKSVNKGIFLKNRDNCKFCPFKGTENCK